MLVTVDVDVYDYLDELTDNDLVEELKTRGYTCVKNSAADSDIDNEDWDFLIKLLDNTAETWYTRRIREKLIGIRFG
jgi:hypothetical protein